VFVKGDLFIRGELFVKRGLFVKQDLVMGAVEETRVLQPNVHTVAEPGPWVRAASVECLVLMMVMFEIHVVLLPADPH
jgi:hypothetical protein